MTESKMQPIEIVDFKAERYLPDGKTIVVSLATKQASGRQLYTLPVASLYSFIADLQKLQAPSPSVQDTAAPPKPPAASPARPAPDRIEVTLPRKWMARAVPERNLVLMVFDPQTEKQAGFALPPEAVREMATALVKQAEKLANSTAEKPAQ
jgi:hypothetical protein